VTLKEESRLNAKGYSERDERRILDALGRGLLNEFPNPDRTGCPGSDVLRRIAAHQMPLAEAEHWLDHLTSCSPCYSDFNQFRESYHLARRRTILAIAASILVVATGASWWVIHTKNEIRLAQNTVLDLRNRSVARGSEPVPTEPPLGIARSVSRLDIYLPLGSSDGPYEVRIVTGSGESILTVEGTAKLNNHITSLQVGVNLSSARTGTYIFQVRRDSQDWNSYPLVLK
jgi:hypothetical protein